MAQGRLLRERVAGQSAMSDVVAAQAAAPARGRLARILGLNPLTPQSRAHYRAALGELLVGDVLENLGPSWDVLHDLPLSDAKLDHLVIGRAGVFTVRAASFGRREVTVDGESLAVGGEERDDLRRASAEATEVSELLSAAANLAVPVIPLLVITEPARLTVKAATEGVRVVRSRDLEALLATAEPTLTGDEVAHLSDVADVASTWPHPELAAVDTQQLHRDFGRIRTTVSDALLRRILWAATATIAVYAGVCSVIATLVSVVVGH